MIRSPFISVLLCVYNGEQYVHLAINSILQQTFTDFELVIINDGSSDGTYEIIESFAKQDARIRIIHQENTGLTIALNNGLRQCRGTWIARHDDDDISYPQRFEKQVQYLHAHPEVGLLGTACHCIDAKGDILPLQEIPFIQGHQNLCTELSLRNPFVHTSVMYKREIIEKIGWYSELYPAAEDYECWLRMSKVTHMDQLPEKLVQRRLTPGMICQQNTRTQRKSVLLAKWHHRVWLTLSIKTWIFILRDIYRIIVK